MPSIVKRLRKEVMVPARAIAFRATAGLAAQRHRKDFESVETFCVFLGDGRSGSSILGAIIDAHEEAIVAHELNVLERLESAPSRDRLFYELLHNSSRSAKRGRQASGYGYEVPNQWQGRFRRLRVIGDKKAGGSSKILGRDPGRLEALERLIGVEVRGIHALRNPFDTITTVARRRREDIELRREDIDLRRVDIVADPACIEVRREDIEGAIGSYFEKARTIDAVKQRRGDRILDLRHEDFVADPIGQTRALCAFLGLDASDAYLEDCSSIVYTSTNRSRDGFEWPLDLISSVESEIRKFQFLQGYSWSA